MDKSQILSAFNDHFTEFVEDIQRVFPQNTDIATLLSAVTKIRKINPKLVIKVFNEHVIGSYDLQINQGDINFFINNDYKKDLADVGSSNMILEKIDLLRQPIREMDQDEQAKVMKYIQNLSKLCGLYNTTF
jgi:squalene cyclase